MKKFLMSCPSALAFVLFMSGMAAIPQTSLAQMPSILDLNQPGFGQSANQSDLWGIQEWDALVGAAQHTAGASSYSYKTGFFANIRDARMAQMVGFKREAPVNKVLNLVEVNPQLRAALSDLYLEGDRTKPIAYTKSNGDKLWVVMELVNRGNANLTIQREKWLEPWFKGMVDIGHLPKPSVLLSDLRERSRIAYWRATSLKAVKAIPSELSPNVEYGNGSTPLLTAVATNQMEMAKLLVDKGADTNRCGGIWGCPLHAAVTMKANDIVRNSEMITWLISKGAKVDITDLRFYSSSVTPLTRAVEIDKDQLVKLLLSEGASVDGVPGVRTTPLELAFMFGKRSTVELLLSLGARVLPFSDRSENPPPQMNGNIYSAALGAKDKSMVSWAEKLMLDAARTSPEYAFTAHLEQDGRRIALQREGKYELKAAPFKLVLTMKPPSDGNIDVGASLSPQWFDEMRKGDKRSVMFNSLSAGSLVDTARPDSYEIYVVDPCSAEAKPDQACVGSFMGLQTDRSVRADFHEIRQAQGEYVREVRGIFNTSAKGADGVPIEKMAGKSLYMLVTNSIYLDSTRHIAPHYITLSFK